MRLPLNNLRKKGARCNNLVRFFESPGSGSFFLQVQLFQLPEQMEVFQMKCLAR